MLAHARGPSHGKEEPWLMVGLISVIQAEALWLLFSSVFPICRFKAPFGPVGMMKSPAAGQRKVSIEGKSGILCTQESAFQTSNSKDHSWTRALTATL